jgi:hypothetical protein
MGGLAQFYPFYLSQHANRTCRRLHFVGTTLGLVAALHSFMGDWVMWKDLLTGRIRF